MLAPTEHVAGSLIHCISIGAGIAKKREGKRIKVPKK
jgi:hypothetical protein